MRIALWIREIYPKSPCQTEVMQKFRISKREICPLEEALMKRGLVVINPFPHSLSMSGVDVRYSVGEKEYSPSPDPVRAPDPLMRRLLSLEGRVLELESIIRELIGEVGDADGISEAGEEV